MRVIGNIKPDWTVVKYETEEDFKEIKEEEDKKYGVIFELCRGLINYDFVIDEKPESSNYIKYGTCFIQVRMFMDSPKVKVKISPKIKDFDSLEGLVRRIKNFDLFANRKWHEFKDYEIMIKQISNDYYDWVEYTKKKIAWDEKGEWDSTLLGYELLFPIWRDIEKIIFKV